MKKIISVSIFILFALTACSPDATTTEDSSAEIARELPSPTSEPTKTPLPPATSTPLPPPTETPTPTPSPSPTPEMCDLDLLGEAVANLVNLNSYQNLIDIQGYMGATEIMTLNMDTTVSLNKGQVEALDASMQATGAEEMSINMILLADNFYFNLPPSEEWDVLTGEMGNTLLARFTDTQFLNTELIDVLAGADCLVSHPELSGEIMQMYSYSPVDLTKLSNFTELTLGNPDMEIGAATVDIWFQDIDNQTIPVRLFMTFFASENDTNIEMNLSQAFQNINESVNIKAPEDVAVPKFIIDVPIPEDAQIATEGENLLVFVTEMPSEEVQKLYITFLEDNNWVQFSKDEVEEQGILFAVVEYSRENQEIAVLVGEQNGYTIVSIAGGDAGGE